MKSKGVVKRISNDTIDTVCWLGIAGSFILFFTLKVEWILIAIPLLILSLTILTFYEGIELDTQKGLMKETKNFWKFLSFGKWVAFPSKVAKIELFHKTEHINASYGAVHSYSGYRFVYVLRLNFDKHEPIIIGNYRDKNKAISIAKQLATEFQVEMEGRLPKK